MECDIIKKNKFLDFFGLSNLPVGWTVTCAKQYQTEQHTRTHEEALELAYQQLESELSTLSFDAQVLRKQIVTTVTDDSVRLSCSLVVVENIAEQVEFEITD